MPAKSGLSHAVAAFVSIVLGALISNFLSAHARVLTDFSHTVGGAITGTAGLSLPKPVTGMLVVSTVLAFLWGITYHYARHGTGRGQNRRKRYIDNTQSNRNASRMSAQERDEGSGELSAHERRNDVDGSYQTVVTAKRADSRLRSTVEREIAGVQSRFEALHDDLYDMDEHEAAERVASLRDLVRSIDRRLHQTIPGADVLSTLEDVDGARQDALVDTHVEIIDTVNGLVAALGEAETGSGGGKIEHDTLDDCERFVRGLDRAVSKRREVIQQIGENS